MVSLFLVVCSLTPGTSARNGARAKHSPCGVWEAVCVPTALGHTRAGVLGAVLLLE